MSEALGLAWQDLHLDDVVRFGCFGYSCETGRDSRMIKSYNIGIGSGNERRRRALRGVADLVNSSGPATFEILHGEQRLELPSEVIDMLRAFTEAIAEERPVVVTVSDEALLTSQQVAEIFNVSRPYVVKLARSGVLPHTLVGTHHRFAIADVVEFERKARVDRADALRELAPVGGYTTEDF